ncbi:MAG: DNRLRE domain-containing protein [Bacteroidetes bacterium]|nr:DNRLRE domain-containing protein [Bacteroidota bacterium]
MLICLGALSNTYSQTTVNITYCQDNTLYEDSNGQLSNGSGQYFFTGKTVGDELRRGVIKFLLVKDIPACATITNVSLRLYMSRTISGDQDVELRKMNKDWGASFSDASGEEGNGTQAEEGDATWLHTFYSTEFWDNAGGDFSTDPSSVTTVGGVGYYTWDSSALIQDVQGWLNNPDSNFGWAILGNERDAGSAKRFDSREFGTTTFRPVLTVTYTNNVISLYTASLIEGFFDGNNMIPDSLTVSLRSPISPYNFVASETKMSDAFGAIQSCFDAPTGSYYIVINHRNSIETWSKNPVLMTVGGYDYYDFTSSASSAYGDNLVLKNIFYYCIYSGDVNQDYIVDITDGSLVDNDALNFATGYINTDVNGDMIADLADGSIVDNNASNFVSKISP